METDDMANDTLTLCQVDNHETFVPADPQTPKTTTEKLCAFRFDKQHGIMADSVCGLPLDKPIHRKWDGDSREGAIDISHDFTVDAPADPSEQMDGFDDDERNPLPYGKD